MVTLVRKVAGPKLVVPLPIPGPAGRAMNDGGLLPLENGPRGVMTFDDWIAVRH